MTPTSTTRAAALLLALLATTLPGCMQAGPTTHLHIDFAGQKATLDADVPFDAAGRPAERYDAQQGAPSHTGYTAFDQLVQWADAHGEPLTVDHFSFGFCLSAIDGVPAQPACQTGAPAYWSLSVNGNVSDVGMDAVLLHAGDRVDWVLTPLSASPPPSPPSGTTGPHVSLLPVPTGPFTIEAPASVATRNGTAWVNGTSNAGHRLSLDLSLLPGTPTALMQLGDGTFSLRLDGLAVGAGNLTLYADDGQDIVRATTRVVRLGHATMEVDYKMAKPSRSDEVWFDPTDFASAPLYAGKDVSHPPAYTVHDLMAAWSAQTGVAIVVSYYSGIGYFVNSIDGVGTPGSVGDTTGVGPWCYDVNGTTADKGISTMELHDGDDVAWSLGCA